MAAGGELDTLCCHEALHLLELGTAFLADALLEQGLHGPPGDEAATLQRLEQLRECLPVEGQADELLEELLAGGRRRRRPPPCGRDGGQARERGAEVAGAEGAAEGDGVDARWRHLWGGEDRGEMGLEVLPCACNDESAQQRLVQGCARLEALFPRDIAASADERPVGCPGERRREGRNEFRALPPCVTFEEARKLRGDGGLAGVLAEQGLDGAHERDGGRHGRP
mmetsp:Transcript_39478/g.114291  ORF Transcript_39478/g.114291 Transcript_39478/m.114291 type:complete len:225 (+) Transcript_39478:1986-2660(+)